MSDFCILRRDRNENEPYELLQGSGIAEGHLLGGCIEVLEFAKGTPIWAPMKDWTDSILFFETSEEKPTPHQLTYWLRNYGEQGILQRANGMIFAKPQDEMYYAEYKESIMMVLQEFGVNDLPVLYNVSIGHTEPKLIVPYGAKAWIDCENVALYIDDHAVV